MNPPFQKSVLISGATTGIGLSCATVLADAGFRVFAGYRKAEDADRLAAVSSSITPVFLDLAQSGSIQAARDFVAANLPQGQGLAALVNNAGILVGGPLELVPADLLRLQLEVNVVGHMALTQALLPLLRAGAGRIVNMSSVSGLVAMPFIGPYCISKFAMEAWTDALRMELKPWKMPVVSLLPGSIATPFWQTSQARAKELADQANPDLHALYEKALHMMREACGLSERRGLPPERVACTVLKALTVRNPKTRYWVGPDAFKYRWIRLLPDTLKDRLIAWKIGLA